MAQTTDLTLQLQGHTDPSCTEEIQGSCISSQGKLVVLSNSHRLLSDREANPTHVPKQIAQDGAKEQRSAGAGVNNDDHRPRIVFLGGK